MGVKTAYNMSVT